MHLLDWSLPYHFLQLSVEKYSTVIRLSWLGLVYTLYYQIDLVWNSSASGVTGTVHPIRASVHYKQQSYQVITCTYHSKFISLLEWHCQWNIAGRLPDPWIRTSKRLDSIHISSRRSFTRLSSNLSAVYAKPRFACFSKAAIAQDWQNHYIACIHNLAHVCILLKVHATLKYSCCPIVFDNK